MKSKKKNGHEGPRYHDRDLSWLGFNERVLEESLDDHLELYERIKFLAIHSSNLDEFHRVRVGYLEVKDKSGAFLDEEGVPYKRILEWSRVEAEEQAALLRSILIRRIVPELRKHKIRLHLKESGLSQKQKKAVHEYFITHVVSFLQPVWLLPDAPPFLEDGSLHLICRVSPHGEKTERLLLLNIPGKSLPRFHLLPGKGNTHHILFLDDIIRIGMPTLLRNYKIHGMYSIKMNRYADLGLDEEDGGAIEVQLRQGLATRGLGEPCRFQYDPSMPPELVRFCFEYFNLEHEEMTATGRYQKMSDLFTLPNPLRPHLEATKWKPFRHKGLNAHPDYFEAMDAGDHLLHFPYQSYDHVLIFFNQAVLDQWVTEIMVTFYRVAPDSHIVNSLISAVRNGKRVKVFVEVKARFDEANNLKWAERMKEAGVEISYSLPGIKVHAKAALITRVKDGVSRSYAFYGTGNFNERTAGIYSDIGLLTADQRMNEELRRVFQFLHHQSHPGEFQDLLVSQFNIIHAFKHLIEREIENHRSGRPSGITIKLNNIEDAEMIDALYRASAEGVPINLIVRSICRVIPSKPGLSENICVTRIVGRYLEHSRVFHFKNGGSPEIFLGSADWMSRNLRSRVEVVFPVRDAGHKKEIEEFLSIQLAPHRRTRVLDQDLSPLAYSPKQWKGDDAQETFYKFVGKLGKHHHHPGS